MLLIADSGSTKTSWRYVASSGVIQQFQTVGFNPLHETEESILSNLQTQLVQHLQQPVEQIFFYGAGCGTEAQVNKMQKVISLAFPNTQVAIFDDMLAAARSLCLHKAGIVGILGTGSNSCNYDGKQLTATKGGLGLQLGDEGSGAYLGRKLIMDYLNEEMPTPLIPIFEKRYGLTTTNAKSIVFENVYAKPYPNRYLAQFAKFLFDHRQEAYCMQVVYDSFLLFFDKTICKYPHHNTLPIHFTGSIAFWFSGILRQAATQRQLTVGIISEEPIAGLLLYHQANE